MSNPVPTRTTGMTVLAVLLLLLASSNVMKPVSQMMAPDSGVGLVFFGYRLHGLANAIFAPLLGAFLATYAYGVWRSKRWVVPISVAYAFYVVLNLVLYTGHATAEEKSHVVFNIMYSVVAIGVSTGAAVYFVRNQDHLS